MALTFFFFQRPVRRIQMHKNKPKPKKKTKERKEKRMIVKGINAMQGPSSI